MSIIHEALKKTQHRLKEKEEIKNPDIFKEIIIEAEPENIIKRKTVQTKRNYKKERIILGLLSAILIITSLLFATVLSLMKDSNTSNNKNILPSRVKNPIDDMRLSGTFFADGKHVALMGENIYEVGQNINGKKIVNIDIDGIEIQDGDKIIKIRNTGR